MISARIPEEDGLGFVPRVQTRIAAFMHKLCVLLCLYLGAFADVMVVLKMRESIVQNVKKYVKALCVTLKYQIRVIHNMSPKCIERFVSHI